ncbi:hypothetical protein V6N11_044816 [Hibiscus sabdariffa]|uniref:PGG domain-containing protein n=1 Tax=Hibiscus sabdariffa TaxID=183260 RepID=A0ABR2PU45_9ROSI
MEPSLNCTSSYITYMDLSLYMAATCGKIETFNNLQGLELQSLQTVNNNNVLHVNLATHGLFSAAWLVNITRSGSRLLVFIETWFRGITPSHIAARYGDSYIVRILIASRARAAGEDIEQQETASEAVRRMLRKTDREFNTALHVAVQYGHPRVVGELLEFEDPGFSYPVNRSQETPLYIAARRGHRRSLSILLCKLNSAAHGGGPHGRTALHAAAMAGDAVATRMIIEEREDLTKERDKDGQVPLHYAAHLGHYSVVKELLKGDKSGAYVADEKSKMTPLLMAARQGHAGVVREMMACCPDDRGQESDEWEDEHGITPQQVYYASQPVVVPTLAFKDKLHWEKDQIIKVLKEIQNEEVVKSPVSSIPILNNSADRIEKARDAHLVVATLIATVTFAAAITFSGSEQDTPVLLHDAAFGKFVVSNALDFLFSLIAVAIHFEMTPPFVSDRPASYPLQGTARLGIILSLLSLFLIKSESAVSSIDLGSEWLKVAVVNLKPGQSPITIAINEMSKRKSPALVAFQSETRLLAEEAAGIVARYPDKVFSNLRDMVGKSCKDVKRLADSMYLPFDIVEDFRGAAMIRVSDDVSNSVEELLGMILKYAANLAEFHSKATVKDAVISVPPYFGQAERKGLMAAAHLAGVNVISLINEHSGAALQYGIDKDFSNGSRHVIFYDMGSSSTYAALVYFSAYNAKELGKTISVNQFQVKDVRWDSELGGQNMELRLVEYFADEFNKQLENGADVRKYPKAMAKLKKQVKRTKEILSANTAASISVESLYDDRDFRSTITREKFEELCGDLWDKSLIPVKEVLKHSGLQADDIYAVELIGGATRVPKLQVKLQEYFGRKDLDKHLDADEAIVLGAALHAANLSDGIKLNRKLGMLDGSSYSFFMELDGANRLLLVHRMKKIPRKIFKSFNHSKDFEVSLAYDHEDLLPPGLSSPVFAQYAVSGLRDATEKYSSRNLSSPVKTNLHFSLSRSGILSLDRAEAVFQVTEWIEVPKRNLTVENSTRASPNVSADLDTENTSEQSNNNLESDGGISNSTNSTIEESNTVDLGTERKLKRLTFRIPLKIVEKTMGPGIPLSKESLLNAKSKLEALDKKDAERRRTAELKNNLEEYIYATKEKFETSEDFERISSNDERQSVIKKLDEVQEWLYTDGEDATATEFQDRLNLLKASADPIIFRFKELTARPEAVNFARKYLTELRQTIHGWEKDKPWLPKDRIEQLSINMDKFKTWLDEKEAEQQNTSGPDTPVFTSKEVYEKIIDIQEKADSIKKIPKPKPKEKPVNNKTKTNSENAKTADDSTPKKGTSQTEKPAENSDSSENEEAKEESELHEEL